MSLAGPRKQRRASLHGLFIVTRPSAPSKRRAGRAAGGWRPEVRKLRSVAGWHRQLSVLRSNQRSPARFDSDVHHDRTTASSDRGVAGCHASRFVSMLPRRRESFFTSHPSRAARLTSASSVESSARAEASPRPAFGTPTICRGHPAAVPIVTRRSFGCVGSSGCRVFSRARVASFAHKWIVSLLFN